MAFCPSCGAQIADGATCPKCAGSTGGAVAKTTTAGGLDDNVAGALAYVTIIPLARRLAVVSRSGTAFAVPFLLTGFWPFWRAPSLTP